jgi:glutamate-1-semialdehyde 2,1-aminomutase
LRMLLEGDVYEHLERLGELARKGLEKLFESTGTNAAVTGLASTFGVHFRYGAPRDAREMASSDFGLARRYYAFMLSRGIVYLTPSVPHMFLNAAHTEQDVQEFVSATADFVETISREPIGS